jgi:KipI family sensor histidine kinase inhibitor
VPLQQHLEDDAPGRESDTWQAMPFGDSAVRVRSLAVDSETRWAAAHRLAAAINARPPHGIRSATATYDSILVEFDPRVVAHEKVVESVASRCRNHGPAPSRPPETYVVPVAYGGEWGPDLDDVARELAMSAETLVALHVALAHPVRCLSHSAAPMLDGPTPGREVRRRSVPRVRVAAGSVMVAGRQSMILCADQPSGWRVIGRTPIQIVDPSNAEPVRHRPGDIFRYRRIDPSQWQEHSALSLGDCRAPR